MVLDVDFDPILTPDIIFKNLLNLFIVLVIVV